MEPGGVRAALRAKNTRVSEERPGAGVFRTVEDVASTDDDETPPSAIRRFRRSARSTCDPTACSVASLSLTVAKACVLHLQENDISRLDGLAGCARWRSSRWIAIASSRWSRTRRLVSLRELRMEENDSSRCPIRAAVSSRAAPVVQSRREVSEVEKLGALAELRVDPRVQSRRGNGTHRPMALRHCENLRALDGRR